MPKKDIHIVGKTGERLIQEHLLREGFTIIATNVRIRGGEIDVIAQKKNIVVCVEVKTRTGTTQDMAELISPWQQQRIVTTARHFLTKHTLQDTVTCRFDVALINIVNMQPHITYIPDAFQERE